MQMSELIMSSPHNFPCILYIIFFLLPFLLLLLLLKHEKACPHIANYIRANIIQHLFRVDIRQVLLLNKLS